jgi:hypothetical protein
VIGQIIKVMGAQCCDVRLPLSIGASQFPVATAITAPTRSAAATTIGSHAAVLSARLRPARLRAKKSFTERIVEHA